MQRCLCCSGRGLAEQGLKAVSKGTVVARPVAHPVFPGRLFNPSRDVIPTLPWQPGPLGSGLDKNFQGSCREVPCFAAEEGGKLVAPFPLSAAAGRKIFCLEGIEWFFPD